MGKNGYNVRGNVCYKSVRLCQYANAGIHRRLIFHSGTHNRVLSNHKRNGLTLHVRSHKSTVGVVVFKERNHCRSYRNHHFRRNVHVIHGFSRHFQYLVAVTGGNAGAYKVPFLIQRLVRLSYDILIFHVGGHINHLVGNNARSLVYLAVGGFDKAVLVYLGKGSEIGNKTDVGTFRGFNGTHSSVVGIMYVTNLKAGSVTAETSGSEGGKTSFMGKLRQRVVLIHKLRQRRRAEKFFYRRHNGAYIYKGTGGNLLHLLRLKPHSFADNALHTGKADSELVLDKLAYGADTSVS